MKKQELHKKFIKKYVESESPYDNLALFVDNCDYDFEDHFLYHMKIEDIRYFLDCVEDLEK